MKSKRYLLICVLMQLFIMGCYFPIPKRHINIAHCTRGEISKENTKFIKNNQTTFEEVLLHIGEPDYIYLNEKIIIYEWQLQDAVIIPGILLDSFNFLLVYFDLYDNVIKTEKISFRSVSKRARFLKILKSGEKEPVKNFNKYTGKELEKVEFNEEIQPSVILQGERK